MPRRREGRPPPAAPPCIRPWSANMFMHGQRWMCSASNHTQHTADALSPSQLHVPLKCRHTPHDDGSPRALTDDITCWQMTGCHTAPSRRVTAVSRHSRGVTPTWWVVWCSSADVMGCLVWLGGRDDAMMVGISVMTAWWMAPESGAASVCVWAMSVVGASHNGLHVMS